MLVVVPTITLKEQWGKIIDSLGFSFNCDIQVINTVITREWECDLLVIDEIHLMMAETFKQVFEKVKYKLVLGLTATFERLDGRHEICNKYCPVCDEIPIVECLANGWVSPYKEYVVLVDVDDIETYNEYNKEFTKSFEFFGFDFGLAMSMTGKDGWRNQLAYREKLCPRGNEEQKKNVLKNIKYHSVRFSQMMSKRKAFINNHPKKIELARRIIEARPFSKIITFSNNVKMAESIGMGGLVYTGKISKKKGRTTIEEFSSQPVGILHTVKKCDAGLDVPGLSVGIILGTDSSEIKAVQRLGRVCRFEDGKQAEIFYIVINNTVESDWVQRSHKKQPFTLIDEEGLNDVLEGKEPRPYTRNLKNFTFRF